MLSLVLVSALSQLSFVGASDVPDGRSSVHVRIETDDPRVQLFRHLGTQVGMVSSGGATGTVVVNQFNSECQTPCDETIEKPGDQFFVGGSGITVSDPFNLRGHGAAVTLKVKTGSSLMRWGGYMMVTLGLVSALTGGILWGVSAMVGDSAYATSATSPMKKAGMAMTIGGGALALGGIPLIAFSGTKVEFLPGPSTTPAAAPGTASL